MPKFIILFFFLFFAQSFSQQKIKHVVKNGESVYLIAKKYNVTQAQIIDLNPTAKNNLQPKMVLLIPNVNDKKEGEKQEIYEIKKGETLFDIAKKNETSLEEIKKLNPNLNYDNIKIGTKIILVEEKKTVKTNKKDNIKEKKMLEIVTLHKETTKTVTHEVLPKETLYRISKFYNVAIDAIKNQNPNIDFDNLKMGTKLQITTTTATQIMPIAQEQPKDIKPQVELPKTTPIVEKTPRNEITNQSKITHIIQPKETKYGITKKYQISVAQLEKLNPQLPADFPVGYNLIIKEEQETIQKDTAIQPIIETPKTVKDSTAIAPKDTKPQTQNSDASTLTIDAKADYLIQQASNYIGTKYRSGGKNPGGFDCSGFMMYTFNMINFLLPRTSQEQSTIGEKVDRETAKKGDLIFFATHKSGISHVGMVVDNTNQEIKFIHSSSSKGVMISSLNETYFDKRFVQINRVLPLQNNFNAN